MFNSSQIEKFLFFDIETAGTVQTSSELSPRMNDLWNTRSEYLIKQLSDKYPDNANKSASDLFIEKAALQAEFGRIVCISFGKVKFNEDSEPIIQLVSYTGDESSILNSAFKLISGLSKNGVKLVGHNIKRFDIPFMCKRSFINRLELPEALKVWDKKPWEIPVVDTCDLWSFGAWQEGFTALDLLTAVLGIQSPKDEMKGSEVHRNFYAGEILEIQKYCQKDVISLAQVILALSNLNQIEDSNIIIK